MEILWAPWRMQFIEGHKAKGGGCIFCELALSGDDEKRLVLYRGQFCYVVMNRFPYSSGHLMVVPYRHTGSLEDFTSDENSELLGLAARASGVLSRALDAEGINTGINVGRVAGAGIVDHIHLHVVPRWTGDTNFLPIFGGVRSMPEYLSATYARLVRGFGEVKEEK